jgi:hypothetical protein
LAPLPDELAEHVQLLRRSADARKMFDEGWEPLLITDLRRVVAAQSTVRAQPSTETVPIDNNLTSLARLTLPLERPMAEVPATFDPASQTWRVTSQNPNMRITGRFGGKIRDGALGFGFVVEVLQSFLSVAEYRGRFVLRDGYHRAHRLMLAGIFSVPAFVRSFAEDESLFSGRMLPEAVWTGDRPPLLGDFMDTRVSHDIWLPEVETTLLVRATPTRLALDPKATSLSS